MYQNDWITYLLKYIKYLLQLIVKVIKYFLTNKFDFFFKKHKN